MQSNKEKQVVFKCKLVRNVCDYDSFKVYAVTVDKNQYPDIKLSQWGNVTIKGDIPTLVDDVEYEIKAVEQEDKYGVGYKVISVKRDMPKTIDGAIKFLEEFTSENRAREIVREYPDIIDRIENNRFDDIDYSKMNGLAESSFMNLMNSAKQNISLYNMVDEFNGILSLSMLRKIYNRYGDSGVIPALQKEPYKALTQISGIGFKTADATILKLQKENVIKFDHDIKTSVDRCSACIRYVLEQNETAECNTKMNVIDLRKKVIDMAPECVDKFDEAILDESIYFNKDTLDVALIWTYRQEKYIAETIYNNIRTDDVWQCDIDKYKNVNGIELSDEQLSAAKNLCENKISILNGAAGCVDCDTEYFNGTEWKKISDFKYGEMVLQYNDDGTAELVYPMNYIKQPADYLWEFKTKYGLNQCLSDSHECYYITSKGNLYHKSFKEVRENHEQTGFKGGFITTFDYSGPGIDLTDDEIRLMVATFADGSFYYRNNCSEATYRRARFHIKKDRKKQRLTNIAENIGLGVRVVKSAAEGYDDFYINVPFRAKHYPKEWYNCNKHQLQVIADEVMFWDGHYKKNNGYSTTCKADANFIQFVFSSLGYRATIRTNDRFGQKYLTCGKIYERKSVEYTVLYTNRTIVSMCVDNRPNHTKTPITRYKTKDGYEYCFTVPSHMLVLRRGDRIFVTGNCGKSFSTQAIIHMLDDIGKTYKILAPTGKASKVIAEFTKRRASTIHRGLQYGCVDEEGNIWGKNENNKLDDDVVIVDEFSMVDVDLFYNLLKAIDFNKTRLMLIGDSAQLASVGCGNLLHDFMQSKIIPTTTLTKIFRYGEGGLMKVATDIRKGNNGYLKECAKNKANVFGDNKDYVFFDLNADKDMLKNKVLLTYKKLVDRGVDASNIQVLAAKNAFVDEMNLLLQKIANPNCHSDNYFEVPSTGIKFFEGDIVMQCANNYNAPVSVHDMTQNQIQYFSKHKKKWPTAFVANGESGVVKYISDNMVHIQFDNVMVQYTRKMMTDVKLGYAITIHKSQGSSIDNVILVTPKSDMFILNSNLIYVGCTRTRKRCYHFSSVDAMKMAIRKKQNFSRKTFMQQMLKELSEKNNC